MGNAHKRKIFPTIDEVDSISRKPRSDKQLAVKRPDECTSPIPKYPTFIRSYVLLPPFFGFFNLFSRLDIKKRNASGETMLHQATIKGNADLVALLLQRGAEVNTKDNAGSLCTRFYF